MSLLDYLFGCSHEDVTWPQRGRQSCLHCGASRRYRRIGVRPGKWETEVEILRAEDSEETLEATPQAARIDETA
jgi:hypothetical protein